MCGYAGGLQSNAGTHKKAWRENDEPAISLSLPSVQHKGPLDGILFIRQTSERERACNKSTSSQAHADSGAAYIKIRGKSGIIRCAAENVEGIQIPRAHMHTLNLRSSRTLLSVGSLSLSLWWVRHRTVSSLETDCGQFPALISQITCIRQVKYLNHNKIIGKEA